MLNKIAEDSKKRQLIDYLVSDIRDTDRKRWKSSKSTYYTEDILSNLHKYMWAPTVGARLITDVPKKVPLIGLGISATDMVGRIAGSIASRRTPEEQKAYESSLLKKLLNVVPGVAGYNAVQSKRAYSPDIETAARRVYDNDEKQEDNYVK